MLKLLWIIFHGTLKFLSNFNYFNNFADITENKQALIKTNVEKKKLRIFLLAWKRYGKINQKTFSGKKDLYFDWKRKFGLDIRKL